MRHAAGLDHVEYAVALAIALKVLEQNPRIHERGHGGFALLQGVAAVGEAGEERGDQAGFEVVDQAGDHAFALGVGARAHQAGDGVHDDDVRLEGGDFLEHRREMHL